MLKRTPNQERYIRGQKRSRKAKSLGEREKPLNAKLDAFYHGKSSFKDDSDRRELNFYMEVEES